MLIWIAAIVALTVAVVYGVVKKRRIERQETMLSIRLELLSIVKDSQNLMSGMEQFDLISLEKLAQFQQQLEDLLVRLENVEQLYGVALAKKDTDSDAEMLEHLMHARDSLTSMLNRARANIIRLESKPNK